MTRIVSEKSYCTGRISMEYLSLDRFKRGKHTEKCIFQVTVCLHIIYTHILYTHILLHTRATLIFLDYGALIIVVSTLRHYRPYPKSTTTLIWKV